MGRDRRQRTQGRGQTRNNTQVRMHGWDDAYEADLSHKVRCETNVHQWAARSVLSTACCERPCARCVLVVHRIVLKRGVVMRKGVRNVVAIRSHFCIVNRS